MFRLFAIILCIIIVGDLRSQSIVSDNPVKGFYPLIHEDIVTPIYVDSTETALILKSAELLQSDIALVTGIKPPIIHSIDKNYQQLICIGTAKSQLINKLVQQKKISLKQIENKWEAFTIKNISKPFSNANNILLITGSDRRGVAYGVFEFSKQLGVSPWYWWADVPAKKKNSIYVPLSLQITDYPKVKYRGIFINDEAPALSNWSREKFGGFNHRFYEKVFELMLRLKANYIWPAMWGNAFYDDDSLNIRQADEYGIVIGTSHHEPLMRAHDEWRRYGRGKWNYDSNEVVLKQFWKKGLQRSTNEKIITIGMRGDGDEPMTRETATALLERIVKDQRNIIEDVTGKPASESPQLWALYKEVQDYYDKGMRVPDDVTLLLCDDNWGNIRKLPKLNEAPRKGGYGIYYHFDYVGGPRNYKWINTNNISRVWEQMHLAWEYNARQIWIVNVGDIKPMEFPISFFLDYAWNPKAWNETNLLQYYTKWAAEQFGVAYSKEIGKIIQKYSQYNARRKPELLNAATYNVWLEWPYIIKDWNRLVENCKKIRSTLSTDALDAFYQLVEHPVEASANLNEMYYNIARNKWYAEKKYLKANEYAAKAKENFIKDSLSTTTYHQLNNNKWNHMMSQTHIGYTYWQQPPFNRMPQVNYVSEDSASDDPMMDSTVITYSDMIPSNVKGNVFYQFDGYVSIEAEHYTRKINGSNIKWGIIPEIGRTGSGITTFPVNATSALSKTSPHLEYDFYCGDTGKVNLQLYFSPTLNFHNNTGLQFAVSIDDQKPEVILLNKDDTNTRTWEKWVADNIIIKTSAHHIKSPGKHTIKYWMISPAVVLQKIVLEFHPAPYTYLGPHETLRK